MSGSGILAGSAVRNEADGMFGDASADLSSMSPPVESDETPTGCMHGCVVVRTDFELGLTQQR